MSFESIAIGSLAQAGVPGLSSTLGSAFVTSIPYLEAAATMSAIVGMRKRKRVKPARGGGYGRMNTVAGRLYGRTNVGRSLTIRGTHTFKRTIQTSVPYVPSTGFQSGVASLGLSMAFSLSSLKITTGSVVTQSVPGFTDLTNLFDKWRLVGVTVKVFFQNNSSLTSSILTCMPLLNYVWDTNDDAVPGIGAILQYPTVRQFQFGNGAAASGCLVTSGKPLAHLGTGDDVIGGTTGGTRPEKYGAWCDTSVPQVQHNSLKMYLDSFSATQATSEGAFSFYVDMVYQCKDAN